MAITARKFSKVFRGSIFPGPHRAVFVPQFASNQFRRKKYTFTKCRNLVLPVTEKILNTDMSLT